MTPRKRRVRWLWAAAAVALVAALIARPAWHLAGTAWHDEDRREPVPAGHADDASRLERTRVAETWEVPADPGEAERQLAALLRRAADQGLPVSIAGARHSMGGHTIAPDGIVVQMRPFAGLRYDDARGVLVAGAGATWSEAIAFLNPRGRSLHVVQSFSSFTVGGSIGVAAHGWQFREPPLGASVVSMRVMTADGRIVRCSRTEEPELFSLVIGGYGLFGIVLDAELRTVTNERYRIDRCVVPTADLEAALRRAAVSEDAVMAYGRLDVSSRSFLSAAILNVFCRLPDDPESPPASAPLADPSLASVRRTVFRGTVGSDYGKTLRWDAETQLEEHMAGSPLWRNQLLDNDVSLYEDRSADATEVLFEAFVPAGTVEAFLADARRIVPAHPVELLNVTVRFAREDRDAFLRWADRDVAALVFLFRYPRTDAADAACAELTRALIDAALAQGGRYYLPYRRHATREQFAAAYPQARSFFELKRRWDPGERFRNRFYDAYGK